MAHSQVVITQSNANTPALGGLFDGLSFFLLQRLPSRTSFIDRIQANGGRVVRQENQADHIIADHYRHDCPAGSTSYTFIETAIRTNTLPDPRAHAAGARQVVARPAGSGAPGKGTRTPFTAEDDRVLWQWVKQSGGPVKGNEIYKQLEAQNSRHTWQAWRDRYVKRLMDKPPVGRDVTVLANPPPSPPTAQDEEDYIEAQEEADVVQDGEGLAEEGEFTEDELRLLLDQGSDIENIQKDREDEAWDAWAQTYPQHSAQSWRRFWEEEGQAAHLKRKQAEEQAAEDEWSAMQAKREVEPEDADDQRSLEHEAKSAERVPSSSQKRKKPTFGLTAERTYGKKKHKSDNDEIFGGEDSNDGRAIVTEVAEQQSPTSEFNEQAQAQLEREYEAMAAESLLPAREAVQDAHAEAQARFDEEVLKLPKKPLLAGTHLMSDLPTSDINHAADQQLRRESLERDEEDIDESSQLRTPSVESEHEGEAENEVDSIKSQEPEHGLKAVLDATGDRLTEANLASQQAEHKAQLLRGADLPEDNDTHDSEQQDEYVRYLQSLTGKTGGMQSMPATTFETQNSLAIGSQLPQTDFLPAFTMLETRMIAELPQSSQEEVDGVLDDMIQWPESPVTAQRRDASQSQSQSIRPTTQVPYPELPNRPSLVSQGDGEVLFSDQLAPMPGVSYPSLPESQAEPVHSEQSFGSQQQEIADDDGSIGTSEESLSSQDHPEHKQDIDLSMAAPEGGWSSSPAKAQSSQATPVASRQKVRVNQGRQPLERSQSPSQPPGTHEVVELSSSSTSSSSSSSDTSEELPSDPLRAPATPPRTALETQDVLNAETQEIDLSMPLPPESDDGNDDRSSDPSSPVARTTTESQRQLAETQRIDDEDVDTYITTMIFRGFQEASIIAALKCTSMRTDLVDLVLLYEKLGKGLPEDVAGIWSEEEDKMLESGNARGLRRLEEKHSWHEAEERMKFLVDWREESVDGDGVE